MSRRPRASQLGKSDVKALKPTPNVLRSGAALKDILHCWDRGSRASRIKYLEWLIATQTAANASASAGAGTGERDSTIELDRILSGGSSLLFTRVTSWFRLTYAFGARGGLRTQLTALHTFLSAAVDSGAGAPASGISLNPASANYLTEFVTAGGIPTLLQCLIVPHDTIGDDERQSALKVLAVIARASRALKELMCQQKVVWLTVRVLSTAGTTLPITSPTPLAGASAGGGGGSSIGVGTHTSAATLECAKQLLILLGTGNPRYASLVHEDLLAVFHSPQHTALSKRMAAQVMYALLRTSGKPWKPATASPARGTARSRDELKLSDSADGGDASDAAVDVGWRADSRYVDGAVVLFQNNDVQLQYDSYNLLTVLVVRHGMGTIVLQTLCKVLQHQSLIAEQRTAQQLAAQQQQELAKSSGTGAGAAAADAAPAATYNLGSVRRTKNDATNAVLATAAALNSKANDANASGGAAPMSGRRSVSGNIIDLDRRTSLGIGAGGHHAHTHSTTSFSGDSGAGAGGGGGGSTTPHGDGVQHSLMSIYHPRVCAVKMLQLLATLPDTTATRKSVKPAAASSAAAESGWTLAELKKSRLLFGSNAADGGSGGDEDVKESSVHDSKYTPKAAARVVRTHAQELCDEMVGLGVVRDLIQCLCDTHNFELQQIAAATLFILHNIVKAAAEEMNRRFGATLYAAFLREPETVYRALNHPPTLHALRSNLHKPAIALTIPEEHSATATANAPPVVVVAAAAAAATTTGAIAATPNATAAATTTAPVATPSGGGGTGNTLGVGSAGPGPFLSPRFLERRASVSHAAISKSLGPSAAELAAAAVLAEAAAAAASAGAPDPKTLIAPASSADGSTSDAAGSSDGVVAATIALPSADSKPATDDSTAGAAASNDTAAEAEPVASPPPAAKASALADNDVLPTPTAATPAADTTAISATPEPATTVVAAVAVGEAIDAATPKAAQQPPSPAPVPAPAPPPPAPVVPAAATAPPVHTLARSGVGSQTTRHSRERSDAFVGPAMTPRAEPTTTVPPPLHAGSSAHTRPQRSRRPSGTINPNAAAGRSLLPAERVVDYSVRLRQQQLEIENGNVSISYDPQRDNTSDDRVIRPGGGGEDEPHWAAAPAQPNNESDQYTTSNRFLARRSSIPGITGSSSGGGGEFQFPSAAVRHHMLFTQRTGKKTPAAAATGGGAEQKRTDGDASGGGLSAAGNAAAAGNSNLSGKWSDPNAELYLKLHFNDLLLAPGGGLRRSQLAATAATTAAGAPVTTSATTTLAAVNAAATVESLFPFIINDDRVKLQQTSWPPPPGSGMMISGFTMPGPVPGSNTAGGLMSPSPMPPPTPLPPQLMAGRATPINPVPTPVARAPSRGDTMDSQTAHAHAVLVATAGRRKPRGSTIAGVAAALVGGAAGATGTGLPTSSASNRSGSRLSVIAVPPALHQPDDSPTAAGSSHTPKMAAPPSPQPTLHTISMKTRPAASSSAAAAAAAAAAGGGAVLGSPSSFLKSDLLSMAISFDQSNTGPAKAVQQIKRTIARTGVTAAPDLTRPSITSPLSSPHPHPPASPQPAARTLAQNAAAVLAAYPTPKPPAPAVPPPPQSESDKIAELLSGRAPALVRYSTTTSSAPTPDRSTGPVTIRPSLAAVPIVNVVRQMSVVASDSRPGTADSDSAPSTRISSRLIAATPAGTRPPLVPPSSEAVAAILTGAAAATTTAPTSGATTRRARPRATPSSGQHSQPSSGSQPPSGGK